MTGSAVLDAFLLGFAAGLALLTLTAYRHASPAWLRWLLILLALLMAGRYAVLTLISLNAPERLVSAAFPALALSAVMAIDHVVRHPAMTPRKLLQWVLPFLFLDGAVILLQAWRLTWILHSLFAAGFAAVCVMLGRKIPSRPIRQALAALAAGQLLLAAAPSLYSEMLMLAALWFAYDTGTRLQQTG